MSSIRVFVPARQLRVTAWAGLVLFPIATALGIWLPYAGHETEPHRMAIMAGTVCGVMSLLSVYLAIAAQRMRVFWTSESVRAIGVFRDRTYVFQEITRARWRRIPRGGSIVLHGPPGRSVIEFASFDGAKELIELFRSAIPQAAQKDYEKSAQHWPARPKPPVIIGERKLLQLAIASLGLAVILWAFWDYWSLKGSMFLQFYLLGLFYCTSIAAVAALDCVRRPHWPTVLATAIGFTASALALHPLAPSIRAVLTRHS
jgi:hypothetical protein